MSRAFVDEDATSGRGEEEVAPLKLPLPSGARNFMTPEGAARQAAELRELKLERRPALAASAAAEPHGTARRALGECDRRIAYLSRMQALLEVVDPASLRSDRVRFGATVTVRQSPEGERRVRIVGVDEAEPGSGAVSWISPIAKSLMGARVGDVVACELPSGPTRMKVLAIDYR